MPLFNKGVVFFLNIYCLIIEIKYIYHNLHNANLQEFPEKEIFILTKKTK
ncbi:hypothetical protein SAMN05421544_10557 [Riemerella columbipharyngis]|uniref:Uncharacterized protein n=1 Tax=Riemerella columbipharyngis TaxID=1071918 RepID=A0A1G7B7D6_9FLAO|nr:hypothetical protein SAMN05421544_10557 [Riemerella columbipharyngis]